MPFLHPQEFITRDAHVAHAEHVCVERPELPTLAKKSVMPFWAWASHVLMRVKADE